jgi:hypothetical protein
MRDGLGRVKGLGPAPFFCLRLEKQLADYSSASYATGTEGWKLSIGRPVFMPFSLTAVNALWMVTSIGAM